MKEEQKEIKETNPKAEKLAQGCLGLILGGGLVWFVWYLITL